MPQDTHEAFMHAALQQAELALAKTEPPFGCVLVSEDGRIVLSEHDRVKECHDMSAHAETLLLKRACRDLGVVDLRGYTLYTTVEPCAMCFTTGWLNKLGKLVYGATMQEVSEATQGEQREMPITCEEMNERSGHSVEIIPGVLKTEAIRLFSNYAFV